VFDSVKTIILRAHLTEVGLLDNGTKLYDQPSDGGSDDDFKDEYNPEALES